MDFMSSPMRRTSVSNTRKQVSRSAPTSPSHRSAAIAVNNHNKSANACSPNLNSEVVENSNNNIIKNTTTTFNVGITSVDSSCTSEVMADTVLTNNNNSNSSNILPDAVELNPADNSVESTDSENAVSNSTTIEGQCDKIPSPQYDKLSQSISPVKKEDLLTTILSSSVPSSDSSALGHDQFDERLDSTENRKSIIVYILQKLQSTDVQLNKVIEENKCLREKCDVLEMKYDEVCSQLDEKNNLLHNINERTDTLKGAETRNNHFLDDIKQENNQIIFDLKRLQSEVSTIRDKADDSSASFGEQESMIKEVELRTAKNQIQLELMKDFCYGEVQDSIRHIEDELVRLDKDITITNQYNRRQNIIIDGIPGNIRNQQLQHVCIDIITKLGFFSHTNPLTPYDVVGCHRLKKIPGQASAPTIIRFTNRKVVEFCINNRNRLRKVSAEFKWNLSFREDLCPANDAIFNE